MARKKPPKTNKQFSTPLSKEKLFSIAQIVKRLPIERSRSTIQDWITRGSRINRRYDSKRIKLEAVPINGCYHTSLEAYERFINSLAFAASST